MSYSKRRRDPFTLWFIVAAIVLIPFSLWMHFGAPCAFYKFSTAGDIPARCLSHYTK